MERSYECNWTNWTLAYSCPPWDGSRRLARCQTTSSTSWGAGCLHLLGGLNQDSREHFEGYFCSSWKHIWIPHTQSVEGNQTEPKSVGGVWRCIAGREEVLNRQKGFAGFQKKQTYEEVNNQTEGAFS